ncbi:hypothetical protein HDU77_000893, partial [Chytriomyces hyalinus]
ITDLVFANDEALPQVSNFGVHDDSVQVASDYHLLTLEIAGIAGFTKLAYAGINIRALQEHLEAYTEELENGVGEVNQQMTAIIDNIERARVTNQEIDWAARMEDADRASKLVLTWIKEAAIKTVGITHFKGGASNADIMEDHVRKLKEWRAELQNKMVEPGISNLERRDRAGRLKGANAIVRKVIRRARKRLYNATNDPRAYDPSGKAKRTACQCARSLRTNHAPHDAALAETDPRRPRGSIAKATAATLINEADVHVLVEWMPSGKAAGEDGIYGKLVKLPTEIVAS